VQTIEIIIYILVSGLVGYAIGFGAVAYHIKKKMLKYGLPEYTIQKILE
jgi:hypothetical protein